MPTVIRTVAGPSTGVAGVIGLLWAIRRCAGVVSYAGSHPGDPAAYVVAAAFTGLAVIAARVGIAGLAHTAGSLLTALPGEHRPGAARLFALAARSSPLLARYALIGLTGVSAGCTGPPSGPAPEITRQTVVDPGWTAAHGDPTQHQEPSPGPEAASPDDAAKPDAAATTPKHRSGAVTVRPGDTLWSIAATNLPADSGRSDIAAEWPRWYRANHHVIGADPDLLLPGQRLTRPTS